MTTPRTQYLIPLTSGGISIGFSWLVTPLEFPYNGTIQLGINSFTPKWMEYRSTTLNLDVRYGYVELPYQFYRPDSNTVTGIPNVSILSESEPTFPWQVFASGRYGDPARAQKTLFTKFLEGWDFTPIIAGETSNYLDPAETLVEIESSGLFGVTGIAFFDYNWFEGVYQSMIGDLPNVRDVSLFERNDTQPAISGFILRDITANSGLPKVLRFVKTTVEELTPGSVAEFNLVLDNGTTQRTVILRLKEA